VRDRLKGKSFKEQMEFGKKTMERLKKELAK